MPLPHPKKKKKRGGIWIILRISFGNLELGEYILTQKKKKKKKNWWSSGG